MGATGASVQQQQQQRDRRSERQPRRSQILRGHIPVLRKVRVFGRDASHLGGVLCADLVSGSRVALLPLLERLQVVLVNPDLLLRPRRKVVAIAVAAGVPTRAARQPVPGVADELLPGPGRVAAKGDLFLSWRQGPSCRAARSPPSALSNKV